MYADSGHLRLRRHCGSRAIMAPGGGGGLTSAVSWRLWSKRQRAEQPTADCDRFSFNRGEGVRKFVGGMSGHNLAAKGGNEGRWSDVAQQSADERVPLFH